MNGNRFWLVSKEVDFIGQYSERGAMLFLDSVPISMDLSNPTELYA